MWAELAEMIFQAALKKATTPSPMSQPGQTPQLKSMDLSQLLSQAQQKPDTPQLQLNTQLPPPPPIQY